MCAGEEWFDALQLEKGQGIAYDKIKDKQYSESRQGGDGQ